jgi:hypothetical protein
MDFPKFQNDSFKVHYENHVDSAKMMGKMVGGVVANGGEICRMDSGNSCSMQEDT